MKRADNLRHQADKCRRLGTEIDDALARHVLAELATDLERRAEESDHERGRDEPQPML